MCRFGKILAMISWLRHLLGWLIGVFRSRQDLMLENLALRQQLKKAQAEFLKAISTLGE